MASFSLEAALRTCKVDQAWANKVQSDRFFNPANMVCPVWDGFTSDGRPACPDSFVTKTAGCNSPEDRVLVENDQRPQYMEYVNLNAGGFTSDLYKNTMPHQNIGCVLKDAQAMMPGGNGPVQHGTFGNQFSASNTLQTHGNGPACCSNNSYAQAMAQVQQANRNVQYANEGFYSNRSRQRSGMM